ncbi:YrdB family protein [Streptacidiphilus sp. P02-A3a]|uniref:YrdB family protein n=1 Tax=Streptacidiphilus sp. P02-A3a TaxID=2704468 RepID=UPI0015FBE411|nr:YrdB family protein [Streptacidiphilus sp. P02-A3a]QMU69517.1 YrdB family protein [Streptacidiphilus sp. P02-A3a]
MALPSLPTPLHLANEALAFLLELAAVGALGWWGFRTGHGPAAHLTLGLGAPIAAMVLWGLFAAPKATFPVAIPLVLLVKAVVFGAAVLACQSLGHPGPAWLLGVAAVLNTALATADREALTTASRATRTG